MKLFCFDPSVAVAIERFESRGFSISRILSGVREVQRMGCMNLSADGVIGFHQATCPQLFLVVAGSGWVTDESRVRVPIAVGQAAFWSAGEWHEAGSATGLTAIAVEAEGLQPEVFLPPLTAAPR